MGVSAVLSAVGDAVLNVGIADVITGAVVGGVLSGVTGGNILEGALMGVAGSYIGAGLSAGASQLGANMTGAGGIFGGPALQPMNGASSLFESGSAGQLAYDASGQAIGGSAGATGAAGSFGATGLDLNAKSPTFGYEANATGAGSTGLNLTNANSPSFGSATGGGATPTLNVPQSINGSGTPNITGSTGSATSGANASGVGATTQVSATGGPDLSNENSPIFGMGTESAATPIGDTTATLQTQTPSAVETPTATNTPQMNGVGSLQTQGGAGQIAQAAQAPVSSVGAGATPKPPEPGFVDQTVSAIKGLPSSIVKNVTSNPLPVAMAAYGMMNQPTLPAGLNQVNANAATASAAGTELINAAKAGTVTPAQQASINAWTQNAIATVKQYYSQQGLSGSSMEASAINNVMMQAQSQTQNIIQANYTQGMAMLGASNTGNVAVANANIAQDTSTQNMLANLARAVGSSSAQKDTPQGQPVA